MKERGLMFKAEMIRALLDGSKTQTRRVVKPQPESQPVMGAWSDGRLMEFKERAFCEIATRINSSGH